MRVKDLLLREPFGSILEATLSRFWTAEMGTSVKVDWADGARDQIWLGNPHLNFFGVRNADSACFENIQREFGFSTSGLKRIPQNLYVNAAVSFTFRSLLSTRRFSVSPGIPDAAQKLLIGGRNRFRILQPNAGRSTVIAKSGFDSISFDREIAARQGIAAELAPRFIELGDDKLSFYEEYISGTPANRMTQSEAEKVRQEALSSLVSLVHAPTLKIIGSTVYLESLEKGISQLSEQVGVQVHSIVGLLGTTLGEVPLGVSMSHGDFQDANVLLGDDKIYVIDWETAKNRSQLYDIATLSTKIRLSSDKFSRWRQEVVCWLGDSSSMPELIVPADSRRSVIAHAAVWWLEEVHFQMEESRCDIDGRRTGDVDLLMCSQLLEFDNFLRSIM